MDARARRRDARAASDRAVAEAFERCEEAAAERARGLQHAMEHALRRRDACADEEMREMAREIERWRAACARARVQTLRCVERVARARATETARRTLRAWREEIKAQRALAVIEHEEKVHKVRAVLRAWRVVIIEKQQLERNFIDHALTREAEYYDSKCKAAVAKLTVDQHRRRRRDCQPRRDTGKLRAHAAAKGECAMEASMREAFMRGVCALDGDAFRGDE